MDRRERLRRCYYHEELDRPGVYVRTYYPPDDPSYDRLRAFLADNAELKAGWDPPGGGLAPLMETRVEPHSEDFERVVTILHAPGGDLRSSRLASLKGLPGLDEEHFLKTPEDAEAYLTLPAPKAECEVSGFFEADRRIGENGIAEVALGVSPGGAVAGLFGSEAFAIMSITDRDVIHRLCRAKADALIARAKFLLSQNVGPYFAMWSEEFIVPPLHGPRDFADFIVKYEKPIIDLIHDAGSRVHIHCHGSVKKVLPGLVEMGADVLHPFEAPPMGDVTACEAKEIVRGEICLEGNVQIADFYESSAEEMRAQTEALIEDVFDDRRGLIVCPTASPYIRGAGEESFERFKAMVDTVLAWKP